MKAGKQISIVLLSFYCVILFNACSSFGDGDSETQNSSAQLPSIMTVQQAETALSEAEANLNKIKEASKQAQSSQPDQKQIQKLRRQEATAKNQAEIAKQKYDQAVKATKKLGKDPLDPQQSPNTVQAGKELESAQAKASEAKQRLLAATSTAASPPSDLLEAEKRVEKAKLDLAAAKEKESKGPAVTLSPQQQQVSASPPVLSILLPLLLTTLPLLIVIALLHRRTNQRHDQFFRTWKDRNSDLKREHDRVLSKLDSILGKDGTEVPELSQLKKKFQEFEGNLGEIVQQAVAQAEAARQAAATGVEMSEREEPISFPMTAEEYLHRMQDKLLYLKHDYPNGMLIEDSEDGEFALVSDRSAGSGVHYLVPKLSRFPTKQDYHTVYHIYFDCNPPFSGAVTIIKPALVDSADGGWQLNQKGELRVA